eukprot:1158286-Pelagomonas_calceolata.AAC.7
MSEQPLGFDEVSARGMPFLLWPRCRSAQKHGQNIAQQKALATVTHAPSLGLGCSCPSVGWAGCAQPAPAAARNVPACDFWRWQQLGG